MRRNRFLLVLATCLLSIPVVPGRSSAKDCGGAIKCACGDTVQAGLGVAVLDGDLGVCEGLGLGMTTGSVLDCAGHTITGTDKPGAWYGIELDSVSGAQVRNCRVAAFRRGLRVTGGGGHWLVGNEVVGTGNYGIELTQATAANRIESNTVRDSGDEGVHVGEGASNNIIAGNQVFGSKLENVYLFEASGTRLIGNVLADARNAAIFIKHSTNSYVADNIVWDNRIQLRGDSWGNVLEDNALRGDGYMLEAFEDDAGWTYPHDNQVTGGTVFNAGACVRLLGASNNHFQGVTIDDDCTAVTQVETGGLVPSGNEVDLTITEPGRVGARAAVQVSTSSRDLHAGDVLTFGLAAHNGPTTGVVLDLYVGLFLPGNEIGFFNSVGEFSVLPSARAPMQPVSPDASLTRPRFVEVVVPPGVPPGTYQFFAALVTPDALSDGVVTTSELVAFDLEQFTIAP
jgi:parallel beta-helix repeat protein